MKKSPIVTVVAVGIGAALFFVLARFVAIPSPVPNTNISIQYGLLAFMAALFGPQARPAESLGAAIASAAKAAGSAPVLICGSLYLLGDVFALWPELLENHL